MTERLEQQKPQAPRTIDADQLQQVQGGAAASDDRPDRKAKRKA